MKRADIELRRYQPSDATVTRSIFHDAVTAIASADYTPEQIHSWSKAGAQNLATWNQSMQQHESYVALIAGRVVGFTDLSSTGYIDMLFVAPSQARQGVASTLITRVERLAHARGIRQLSANASITALPFFTAFGFTIQREQNVVIHGTALTNFHVCKQLDPPSARDAS